MASGLRIAANAPQVDAATLDLFRPLPTAAVSDCMGRLVAGGARLRPYSQPSLCGTALTVKTAPGDNLLVHKALDMARPGDVIVVDAGGDLTNAIIGERMVLIARSRQLGGLIINGAIRDCSVIRDLEFPVYAAGVTHRGPYKNGPGEINFPIALDGMVICAGDLIVGDDDGLLSIPRSDLEAVGAAAVQKARFESENDPLHESRQWIDDALRARGCEFPESADLGTTVLTTQ